jgi:hypothetical protein
MDLGWQGGYLKLLRNRCNRHVKIVVAVIALGLFSLGARAADENDSNDKAGAFQAADDGEAPAADHNPKPDHGAAEPTSVDAPPFSMQASDPVPAPQTDAPKEGEAAPSPNENAPTGPVVDENAKPAGATDGERPIITTEFTDKPCKRENPDEEELDYFYVQPPEVPGFAGWKTNKVPRSHQNDEMLPMPDRWRIGLVPDTRHPKGSILNPYRQNILKGDYPIIGQSLFLSVGAESESLLEGHRVPTPSGVTSQRAFSQGFFGAGEQLIMQQNFILTFEFFKGETDFKPREWEIHLTPVFNINYAQTEENFAINIDPREGKNRFDSHISFIEAFGEYHFHDISKSYDFVSSRTGIQPFNNDFRGFLFVDDNLGVRLFGNLEANKLQYNLVYFEQLEKDTNSGTNTFDFRHQHLLFGNVIRQDTLVLGYDAIFNLAFNDDESTQHYNENGVIVRPAPIGDLDKHTIRAGYIGFGGNGHIGRFNYSNQFYQAFGTDTNNPLAGRRQTINAQMAALEISYDMDWMTFRASAFHASGDRKPNDGVARGFDSILDDPEFAGGQFSYWLRQGIEGGNALTLLKSRLSLLPNLRTDKAEGQANFVNPGVNILNVGYDAELTPYLTAKLNYNYIQFDHTEPLEELLHQNRIGKAVGHDYSLGMIYRPMLNNQIIITGGVAGLTPTKDGGFNKIYSSQTLLQGFLNLIVRY